jgi:hypothetical protein
VTASRPRGSGLTGTVAISFAGGWLSAGDASVGSAVLECEHPTAQQYQATDLDQGEGLAEEQSADQRDQSDPTAEPAMLPTAIDERL